MERLRDLLGLEIDTGEVELAARAWEREVSDAIDEDGNLAALREAARGGGRGRARRRPRRTCRPARTSRPSSSGTCASTARPTATRLVGGAPQRSDAPTSTSPSSGSGRGPSSTSRPMWRTARASVVEEAFAAGVRLVDTSPMYGRAEGVLGRALRRRGVRASAIVATKIWTPSLLEGRRQFEAQLAAFGGRIEIEQIHNLVAWREHLVVARGGGQSRRAWRSIGATHWNESMFGELIEIMQTGHIDCDPGPVQPARARGRARDVLPLAEEMGIGVIAMRPFAEGDAPRSGAEGPGRAARSRRPDLGAGAPEVDAQSDRRVHVAIPATSSVEHARSNAAAGEPPWFDEEQRRLVERLVAP